MGEIKDLGRHYLRKYVVDGVSSSGENKPEKSDGRATFDKIDERLAASATAESVQVEKNARIAADAAESAARAAGDVNIMSTLGDRITAIENSTREGVVVFATKADMDAELDYDENVEARVYTDPLPVNNGIYRKVGATGAGSWAFVRAIDDYEFSVTVEVSQSAMVIAGLDVSRKRVAVTNPSAAATVALDVTGGVATLSNSTNILLPPQTGIYLDGSDCPTASISAIADQDGVELDLFVSSGIADDPTVDAFVANFATPPTSPRKAAIAALRGGLIASGLLAKMEGLWVFAAANADAASVNWVDGSKTLTTAGSPTFTADRGYTGDATDAVIHTGLNLPTGKFGQNDASMACWVRDTGTGLSEFTLGYGAGAIVANRSLTTIGVRANTTGTQTITKPSGAGGFYGWSRLDATAYKVYWGADFEYTDPVASGSLNAREFLGLAVNGVSGPTGYSARQLSFMCAGAGLTDTEMQTLRVLVSNYLSTVGAI